MKETCQKQKKKKKFSGFGTVSVNGGCVHNLVQITEII